jgi:16S rRNA (adenine1518-N6/adenine1519-N6)-dimethyltransferase
LQALMDRFDVSPRRSFGQNFVTDPNTVRRIARLSGAGPADNVLEIGAGLGSLTLALAETGASVRAVEIDSGLAAALREIVAEADARRVEVVEGDASNLDFSEILRGSDPWILVANLPYNIATPLVLDLLRDVGAVEAMVVMVQREVGERLAAPPGSRARGIPSVLVERRATARVLARVPASVFRPRPRVESVVVRIERHAPEEAQSLTLGGDAAFERLVRAGFGQRRKMLRRSLAGLVGPQAFASAGVDPACRPESLTVHQWMSLARNPGQRPSG